MAGVPRFMYEDARKKFFGLAIGSLASNGYVTSVYVPIYGIRGAGDQRKIKYQLYIDLDKFYESLPMVWVLDPSDPEIRHVNVWPSGHDYCHKLNRNLPSLCQGEYSATWHNYGGSRNLMMFLQHVFELLNKENMMSAARRY